IEPFAVPFTDALHRVAFSPEVDGSAGELAGNVARAFLVERNGDLEGGSLAPHFTRGQLPQRFAGCCVECAHLDSWVAPQAYRHVENRRCECDPLAVHRIARLVDGHDEIARLEPGHRESPVVIRAV